MCFGKARRLGLGHAPEISGVKIWFVPPKAVAVTVAIARRQVFRLRIKLSD